MTALALLCALGVHAAGCSEESADCADALCGDGGSAGSGGTAAGPVSGNGGGGGAGGEQSCDPLAAPADGGCVEESRGIFVRNEGDDSAAGTRQAPVRSLGRAIELAASDGKVVYACAQSFAESIVVPPGMAMYGGLDCDSGWTWQSTARSRVEPSSGLPVRLSAASQSASEPTRIADFVVTAPLATTPGGSSIAVIAEQAKAVLLRTALVANLAAAGSAGADAGPAPAAGGPSGNKGQDASCNNAISVGGAQRDNPLCTASFGGKGGNGGTNVGGTGSHGGPLLTTFTSGVGGIGQPATGTWSCSQLFMDGANRSPGAEGLGAQGPGAVSSTGYAGNDGTAGTPGAPGQGGGGGGGSKRATACGTVGYGAGGGSGGAGGCGGAAGQGGMAGGSSMVLLSLDSDVTLIDSTVQSGGGGAGGPGGNGQLGGNGGVGGLGGSGGFGSPGCQGGTGGMGGAGGPGGGGQGGSSIAIAYTGMQPTLQNTTTPSGPAGLGGDGGTGASTAAKGADGVSASVLFFTSPN